MNASREKREMSVIVSDDENNSDTKNDNGSPVVFQCLRCRSIIGDSTSWVSANEKLAIITLKYVTNNVLVNSDLTMSRGEPDTGSTYVGLQCAECKKNVGRMYKTTSKELDTVRNLYSLSVGEIGSYTVGSTQNQNPDDDSTPDEFLSTAKIKNFLAQVRKIQSLVIMLNKRVSAIESSFEEEEDDDTTNMTESDSTTEPPPHNSSKDTSSHSKAPSVPHSKADRILSNSSSSHKRKVMEGDLSSLVMAQKKKKYK